MFGISGTELVAVAAIALVLVGPEKLPEYSRRLAKVIVKAKRHWQDMRNDVNNDVEQGLQDAGLNETKHQIESAYADVQGMFHVDK